MDREPASVTTGARQGKKQMTREEIVAFFDCRQEAWDNLDAADAFLDMKTLTDELIVDGNHVAQLLNIEGTDLGGFLGMPASGKPFRLAAVFLHELDDHQIVRERRIYDFTGLLMQIGVLKAKPA